MNWLMWLALCLLVIAAVRTKIRKARISFARVDIGSDAAKGNHPGSEKMVCCSRCGVYIPEAEAVHRSGAAFCSEEHGIEHFPR